MVRRRVNDGLPKYCQRRKWGVIYQPYLGRDNGKTKWGEAINLGPSDMTVPQVWAVLWSVGNEIRQRLFGY